MDLAQFHGFDWDGGNVDKSREKHGVTPEECEQVFFNRPLLLFHDPGHSTVEERYYVLGRTDEGRRLFVVFTPRDALIRVISARDMSVAERKRYDQAKP